MLRSKFLQIDVDPAQVSQAEQRQSRLDQKPLSKAVILRWDQAGREVGALSPQVCARLFGVQRIRNDLDTVRVCCPPFTMTMTAPLEMTM